MLIVDSQVHIWAANTPDRPWPQRHAPPRNEPFSANDLLREMNLAGVGRAVIVPPSWEGERNDLGLDAARMHSDRFAVMGRLNLAAPDARTQLATWREQPGMLGLRFTFQSEGMGAEDWLWQAAETAGVPIMISHAPLQLLDQVAKRHRRLRLAIDHLNLPKGKKDDAAFANLQDLLALAQNPNIAVKVDALPSYTTDSYPYRRLHNHIRRVYDAFGPKRMFWGADLTKLPSSYREAVTMFTEEISWFTPEDKEWIMGRGVCEWIDWKLP